MRRRRHFVADDALRVGVAVRLVFAGVFQRPSRSLGADHNRTTSVSFSFPCRGLSGGVGLNSDFDDVRRASRNASRGK